MGFFRVLAITLPGLTKLSSLSSFGFASFAKLIPGLYMGWGLGANDAANIFGPAVTTKMIRFRTSAVLISVFVILGAYLQGPKVMELFVSISTVDPETALIATLAAAVSLHILTYLGMPTSSSQAIVGAVVGVSALAGSVKLEKLPKIIICWLGNPVAAGIIAVGLYLVFSYIANNKIKTISAFERFMSWGVIVMGCYGAYALGANNVANVTGVYYASGMLGATQASVIGAVAIAIGAATYSKKVMYTVGSDITSLSRFDAFIVLGAEALTVHLFTFLQVPVSSSQAVVGAVVGIGMYKGVRSIHRRTIIGIGVGWLATPLLAAALAAFGVMLAQYVRAIL